MKSVALSGTTIGFLRREAFELTFAAGDRILRRGQPGNALYVVLEGEVEVVLEGARGQRVTLARLGVGDTFGELSVLLDAPVSADVVAAENVRVLSYPPSQLERALAERPSLREKLMRRMARSVSTSTDTALDYFQRSQALSSLAQGDGEAVELASESGRMRSLLRRLDGVAGTDDPVMVVGENGTGRLALARLVHERSERSDGPLIVLDCRKVGKGAAAEMVFGAPSWGGDQNGLPEGLGAAHLAHGGTLLLRDVQALGAEDWAGLQGELHELVRRGKNEFPNVRLVATRLPDDAQQRTDSSKVAFTEVLEVPPLRERRRDILPLAERFLGAASEKRDLRFDAGAERALVTRPYRHRNAAELRDVVELAARCAEGEVVRAEHLFDDVGAGRSAPWVDIGRWMRVHDLLRRGWLTRLRWLVATGFAAVIATALAAPGTSVGRIANSMIWGAWEPAVFGLFLVLGPVWCAVCPLSFGARGVQRLGTLGLRPWRPLQASAPWLASLGFLAILWLEAEYDMLHQPASSAWLLLGLQGAAVLSALVFRREVWCRDLCPLGRLAAVLSSGAPLSVGARREVCASGCTSHECYRGTDEVPGCTVFHHPQQAADAHNCKLCLDCLRSCPHEATTLRLRAPLAGVWCAGDSAARLAPFAGGVTAVALLFLILKRTDPAIAGGWLGLLGLGALAVGGGLFTLLPDLLTGPSGARRGVGARLALSLGFLGWGALMAGQVENLAVLDHVWLSGGAFRVSVGVVLQVAMVATAGLAAALALWRTLAHGRDEGVEPMRAAKAGLIACVVGYTMVAGVFGTFW